MLDFHSHILPQVDDGAKSVEDSIAMLKMLKEQGVNTVALTPHYIAMDESPTEFLERRNEAYDILCTEIKNSEEDFPELISGAEVYYYPGILKTDELSSLTLGETNLLLLEMPMAPFSEYALREIEELINSSNIQVVMAHIERYVKFQKKGTLNRLLNMGVLFQVNASFFISRSTKRKALKMFKDSTISFIGSDCHNLTHRPPRIGEAIEIIIEKFGAEIVEEFFKNQNVYFTK